MSNFNDLLAAAARQPEPQRFLFVFLKAVLPKDFTEDEKINFEAGIGGGLIPVMCVDKAQYELSTFAALVEESKATGEDWQLVMIACLAGRNGKVASSSDAETPMKKMVQTVQNGGDLSQFAVFDKNGDQIYFQ